MCCPIGQQHNIWQHQCQALFDWSLYGPQQEISMIGTPESRPYQSGLSIQINRVEQVLSLGELPTRSAIEYLSKRHRMSFSWHLLKKVQSDCPTQMTSHRFVGRVERIVKSRLKALKWQSFYNNYPNLPVQAPLGVWA